MITGLIEKFDKLDIDGILITDNINRKYLSGFGGSAGLLLITKRDNLLFTDLRYCERAEAEAPEFTVCKPPKSNNKPKLLDLLDMEIRRLSVKKLGFESSSVSYSYYNELKEKLSSVTLVPVKRVVEELREIKTYEEIELIKHAASIADDAFEKTLPYIKPGIRESEIRAHLNYFIQTLGGFKESFDIIVASGVRGAVPHAMTSDEIIKEGELIVIDYGASYKGYCSDCTRTILLGNPDERQTEIYNLVEKAQHAAINSLKPGVICKELDMISRKIFEDFGYKEEFCHSLGHGVGLVLHEGPSLSSISEQMLEPGMIVTIEPGLYFTGWGGIRVEDMFLISKNGSELLTRIPHGLKIN